MNRVRGGAQGYTVIETMIFLAISGGLFVIAMTFMNGQQQRTQFTATVRDLDNKIQSVLGNVATGYYNSRGTTKCNVVGGVPSPAATGGSQGTNAACTFIGQTIIPNSDKKGFTITSIAGLRQTGTPAKDVTTLQQAVPTLFTATDETYSLNNSATIESVTYTSGGTPSSSPQTLAFITSFVEFDASNLLKSGSTDTAILAVSHTSEAGIEADLRGSGSGYKINPETIKVCITDGTRYGTVTIKGSSTQTSIKTGSCP